MRLAMKPGMTLAWALLAVFTATAAMRLSRVAITATEKGLDRRLDRQVLEGDPFLLLGMTRGVYVEGVGIVYSAEVNLAPVPGISPFHPEMTKQDWARVRQRKLQRLPLLRQAMKEMMVESAPTLEGMPGEELMVVGVTITRHPQEDSAGIPQQIVMQALKKNLVEAGKTRHADAAIKVTEY